MATPTSDRVESQRRRLPKLLPPEPVGASSDETPRTVLSDESARQRRRNQQRQARQPTPDLKETATPPIRQDISLPPRAEASEERQITKRRKARRRVQSSSQLSPEPSLLQGFEDEVIVERSKKNSEAALPDLLLSSTYAGTSASKSAPTPRIYVENQKTFSREKRSDAELRLGNRTGTSPFGIGFNEHQTFHQQTAEVLKRYTVHVAKQTHAVLQRFFTFIHGINSGYALWFCIFAYVFTQSDTYAFFDTYRSIALISHVLFYIFLAICLVDVLDRIDPVKFNRIVFSESISLQNCAVALLFYAVAMVVNLVMMQTEDALRMTQYANSATNVTSLLNGIVISQGDQWKQLTAVRAAFVLAGWFIVSMHVKKDRLRMMIKNTEEKAFFDELHIDQNGVALANRSSPA